MSRLPALYLCLIVTPVVAQALVTTVAPQLPWTTRATILVLALLTILTLTRRIGRAQLLTAAIGVGTLVLILSGVLPAALAASAVMLAAFAYGSLITRLIRPARLPSAENALYATALGLGVTSYATVGLGLAGWLYPPAALLVIGIPIVLARRELVAGAVILRHAALPVTGPAGPMLAAGVVWAIVVLAYAVAPEVAGDSISYHLGLPRMWIDAGRMIDVPEQIQSYYYLATEMNYTLAMLVAGPAAAKILSLMHLALAITAMYVFTRSMFSARAATIAAALFATTPMIARQGAATYVDLAATLYAFLGTAAVLRAASSRDPRLAVVAGLLLALAVATKLTALLVVAPVLAVLAGWMLLSAGRRSQRVGVAVATATAFVAALAPWPVLRYAQTGNPVFPLLNDVFASPLWPQVDILSNPAYALDRFGLGKDLGAILATPLALSYTVERFEGGQIGSAFGVALLLLPLALVLRRGSLEIRCLALISMAALLVWSLTVPYGRYLLPVFAPLSLLAGVSLDDLSRSGNRLTARVASLIPVLLMVAALPLAAGRIPYEVALGVESREAYLSRALATYDPLRRVAATAGRDSKVLILSFYGGGASDEDRLYAPGAVETTSSLWTQELVRMADPAAAMKAIRGRGFTHVHVDRNRLEDTWARDSVVMDPAFFRGHATLEYQKGGVQLYRLTTRSS